MQEFIKLTTLKNGSIFHLNTRKIIYFEKDTDCTYIRCESDNTYFVKETPEEIRRLIFPRQQSFGPG